MKFKQGVPNDDLQVDTRILQARQIYDDLLFHYFAQGEGTITSTSDGKHMPGSKHYLVPREGEDWRFPDIFRVLLLDLHERLEHLGLQLIVEKDHFHVETK